MRAYKYVDIEFADAVASGSLRIGTFESYGALEGVRRDDGEGVLQRTLNYHIGDTNTDSVGVRAAASVGICLENSQNVIFRKVRSILTIPPLYCFCMSRRLDNMHLMAERPQAVFEVTGVKSLAHAVMSLYPDRLIGFRAGNVTYKSRIVDALLDQTSGPEPFVKSEQFAQECEIRIIWQPDPGASPEAFVTDKNLAIANFLRRVR